MVFNFQFAAKLTKKRQKSGKNKQKKRKTEAQILHCTIYTPILMISLHRFSIIAVHLQPNKQHESCSTNAKLLN